MNSNKQIIEQHYSTYNWPDNPKTPEGIEYFKKTIEAMGEVLSQEGIKEIMAMNRPIRILDICSGSGYGGVALSKLLIDNGAEVELYLTDIRSEPLRIAVQFAKDILHRDIHTIVSDIFEFPEMDEPIDICLMYGLSTPHFNPWELVMLLNRMSKLLQPKGCMIVHEIDRRLTDFIENSYQNLSLVEGNENNVLVSIHHGYDILKGTSKRQCYGLKKQIVPSTFDSYTWGIAETGAFIWTVFDKVEVINIGKYRYLLIGSIPRIELMSKNDTKLPNFIKNNNKQ